MTGIVSFTIEYEEEVNSRWLAEILEIPDTLAYGKTINETIAKVQELILRVLAERLTN